MTAKATRTRRAPAKAPKTRNSPHVSASSAEAEFRRWTPDEVAALQLLPYRSARIVREKCYRRELHHHRDGGRITFTAEDLRLNNQLGAVQPLSA
ncbi:hypothetical protein [Streptomyces sp. NPDC096132]|uniref:hypothetical protein n=1 Tax=Streptomyces sp. NPDC096132 TaxID=3366075 RepID=UPI0038004256